MEVTDFKFEVSLGLQGCLEDVATSKVLFLLLAIFEGFTL